MVNFENPLELPRKLGRHAFIIYWILQAAAHAKTGPVTAKWIHQYCPEFGINSVTAALEKLTSPDIQIAVRVNGGWALNSEGAFQLPLGYDLPNENHSGSDSRLLDEPAKVTRITPGVILDAEIVQKTGQNHSQSDSDNNFALKESLSSRSSSLNLKDSTPPTLGREKEKNHSQSDWEIENQRILAATPILFDGSGIFERGINLDIPPEIVMGWITQVYDAMLRGKCYNPAGIAYNGLKRGDKPKAGYQYADKTFETSVWHDFLVTIGRETKPCRRCKQEFETIDAYNAHWDACLLTPEPEPAEIHELTILDDPVILQHWQKILDRLQVGMPRAWFETWVRDTMPVSWDSKACTLEIGVRNQYAGDWLRKHMSHEIPELLRQEMGHKVTVEFITGGQA